MRENPAPIPLKRDNVHVFPLSGGHVLEGTDCWCLPKIEKGEYTDVVIHNQYAAGVRPPRREN